MHLQRSEIQRTLDLGQRLGLLSGHETNALLWLFEPTSPFAAQLLAADTLHAHIKVEDVEQLPHSQLLAAGGVAESRKTGYLKYAFPTGMNLIFSSIPVAEDDRLADLPQPTKPFLDHAGVDLRQETESTRALFDAVPVAADLHRWRQVRQGGGGRAVYCCHTEVSEKVWAYPPATEKTWTRPLEFAFGPLLLHGDAMGCDLRPIDPAHPRAADAHCCATACDSAATGAASNAAQNTYYAPQDLGRFAEVGRFATATMDKFWSYFEAATATPGALSLREKALIALAIAHSKQCPYCIDSFTNKCLQTGASVEAMHEALHVAAAMAAGIDLVHGVQMHNTLRAKGAI